MNLKLSCNNPRFGGNLSKALCKTLQDSHNPSTKRQIEFTLCSKHVEFTYFMYMNSSPEMILCDNSLYPNI